jgi:hypothetical protein
VGRLRRAAHPAAAWSAAGHRPRDRRGAGAPGRGGAGPTPTPTRSPSGSVTRGRSASSASGSGAPVRSMHPASRRWRRGPGPCRSPGNWRAAAEAWRRLGCPYERAIALADGVAEADLLAALDQLERLGARPAADAVAGRLQELGVRRLPRRPRATLANPAGLTARELEVLGLLGPACATPTSRPGSTSPRRPSTTTSPRSWPSSACARGARPRGSRPPAVSAPKMGTSRRQDRDHPPM